MMRVIIQRTVLLVSEKELEERKIGRCTINVAQSFILIYVML